MGEKNKILSRRFTRLLVTRCGGKHYPDALLKLLFVGGQLMLPPPQTTQRATWQMFVQCLGDWNGDLMQSCWRLQACLGETEGKTCPGYFACFSSHQTKFLKCRMFHCKSLSSEEESEANEPGTPPLTVSNTESLLFVRNPLFQPARLNSHY